ncbi:D-alanyl-D-alanine carboxypeptidase family protein [Halalkalibacillus halophilus]|uniref:D-alanyl-D-alanine carboxypeptidase family protein n=1 Tax=Halalkalibacillus halophilus TaxID=392827 RepID=UPI0004187D37|nr:D-alanyl-D-alanine carboxypeptidase family protein [Halalkalibacillus halophilus]
MRIVIINLIIFTFCFTYWTSPIVAKPNVSAQSAVVIDLATNDILYGTNENESLPVASITKILTAIIAIEQNDLDEKVNISPEASRTVGSSIYTKPGDTYTLEDLIYGLLLRSGNDAALAIAEHVGGSGKGFAHLMNEKASWIGMENSSFQNPHGLDEEGHYSSAYDIALLTSYAMNTSSTFREMFGTKKYLNPQSDYYWMNKNKLLLSNDQVCTGGKTGYTSVAGRTLVTTAKRDDKEIVVVTINAPNDWNDHRTLYEYGFNQLESRPEIPFHPNLKLEESNRPIWEEVFLELNGGGKW